MANSVEPDQTAPEEQSDQGLHCLLRPICPNTKNFYMSENVKIFCYRIILPVTYKLCVIFWFTNLFHHHLIQVPASTNTLPIMPYSDLGQFQHRYSFKLKLIHLQKIHIFFTRHLHDCVSIALLIF